MSVTMVSTVLGYCSPWCGVPWSNKSLLVDLRLVFWMFVFWMFMLSWCVVDVITVVLCWTSTLFASYWSSAETSSWVSDFIVSSWVSSLEFSSWICVLCFVVFACLHSLQVVIAVVHALPWVHVAWNSTCIFLALLCLCLGSSPFSILFCFHRLDCINLFFHCICRPTVTRFRVSCVTALCSSLSSLVVRALRSFIL